MSFAGRLSYPVWCVGLSTTAAPQLLKRQDDIRMEALYQDLPDNAMVVADHDDSDKGIDSQNEDQLPQVRSDYNYSNMQTYNQSS